MDFAAFEQLALQVLFETGEPLGAAHLAYLAGIPVRRAERYLGRRAEKGWVPPNAGADGPVESLSPARRGRCRRGAALDEPGLATDLAVFPAEMHEDITPDEVP